MIRHYQIALADDAIQAVASALSDGHLSDGALTEAFELDMSARFGHSSVVAVSSGTAALYLALKALRIGPGDKVLIPSYTCPSLFAAVSLAGAAPVCADSGVEGPAMTPETARAALAAPVTCAIVPHTLGFLADIDGIRDLGLRIVEDFSQAIGGLFPDGQPVGTKGDIGVASLYATKLVPAGEGGICMSTDGAIVDTLRHLRNCDTQDLDPLAFNFKMSDLNAAVARSSLSRLDGDLDRRDALRRRYDRRLLPWSLDTHCRQARPICFRYLLRASGGATDFIERAARAGLECRRPVSRPLHVKLGGDCPRAERYFRDIVSIPCHFKLAEEHIEHVCSFVESVFSAAPDRTAGAAPITE